MDVLQLRIPCIFNSEYFQVTMGILGHNPTVIQEASVYIFKLKYKTQENV